MIYWFTGQPGSGKTTLAAFIKEITPKCIHIDGDDIRNLYDNKDYSKQGRMKNIELAQNMAYFLYKKGFTVVVSLVSPYREQREEFKKLVGRDLIEIYVHTNELRGREQFHVADYQPPLDSFIDIDTTNDTIEHSVVEILTNK